MSSFTSPTKGVGGVAVVRHVDIPFENMSHDRIYREDRPFSVHPRLAQSLPSRKRMEFAWSRVLPNQGPPAIYSHSSRSLLIVLSGSAELIGVKKGRVKEGDVVALPPRSPYGFTGVPDSGLNLLRLALHEPDEPANEDITKRMDDSIRGNDI